MPRLPGYVLDVHRVVYTDGVAVAGVAETIDVDGTPHITPEALVFDLWPSDGRIRRSRIFASNGFRPHSLFSDRRASREGAQRLGEARPAGVRTS